MRFIAGLMVIMFAVGHAFAAPKEGEVEIPLDEWDAAMVRLAPDQSENRPPVDAVHIARRIEGRFHKGLFRGTLVDRFEVKDKDGYVQVPIIDASVSLGSVLVSGKSTALYKESGMYTLGLDRPGEYEIRLEFFTGEDTDRFSRALDFRLPEGGITTLFVIVPETQIEPIFEGGVLLEKEVRGQETLVKGNIGVQGRVSFSWTRKLTHQTDRKAAMEARLNTVFTFREAVVTGSSLYKFTVREGEADAVALDLLPGVEVVKVEGDVVLQWAQDSQEKGRLTVLLRHLVSDELQFKVQFQMPLDSQKPVPLAMPLPPKEIPFQGAAAIQGPLWLNIEPKTVKDATDLPVRDLPEALLSLTQNPLLYGFRFSTAPTIIATVTRHREIALTSTVVEEQEASTVQLADGGRITKLKLRIRNNTRETMTITLPGDAVLTHALLEGHTVRPALAPSGKGNTLLFPLRQSERLTEGEPRLHTVRPGETLSDIANFYFSNPSKWQEILNANPGRHENSLQVGETLQIPTPAASTFEESTFVLELAYKQEKTPLGIIGRTRMALPKLDVDCMKVLWHLYFPDRLEPLAVESNLVQYSNIRYDPIRRAKHFLLRALWMRNAWAGGKYRSILQSRKAIYATEAKKKAASQTVQSAFPFVGRKYKFKRVLLQQDTASIALVYAHRGLQIGASYLALIIGFCLTWYLLRQYHRIRAWIGAALALSVMLVLAHYFLGMHRRLLWGADLAVLIQLLQMRAPACFATLRDLVFAPWGLIPYLTFRNLLFVVGLLFVLGLVVLFPLLLSSILLLVLLFKWRQYKRQEVHHG